MMMTLNLLDVCILIATVISAVIGLLRGMTKESITLLTWIIAAVIAVKYGAVVGEMFGSISTEIIRQLIGGTLLFIVVLIIGSIINLIVSKFVKISGFVVADKILGAGFGILRSVLILLIILPLINDVFANEPWWQGSVLVPRLQIMAEYIKASIPEDWLQGYTELTSSFS